MVCGALLTVGFISTRVEEGRREGGWACDGRVCVVGGEWWWLACWGVVVGGGEGSG